MMTTNSKIKTCLFVFYLAIGAQVSKAQILIGPNAGLNWSRFSINHNAYGTTLLGSSFGAIAELPLNGILSIRVEPSYIQKGLQWIYVYAGGAPTSSLFSINSYFNYFQIPIELKANLPVPFVSPYLLVGPNVGYLLSAKEGQSGSTPQEDRTDFYKKFDCALDCGAGLDLGIAPLIKASFNVKYSLGLLNIEKISATDLQSHGIQIYAGVLFCI
jgi:hypothetical protein